MSRNSFGLSKRSLALIFLIVIIFIGVLTYVLTKQNSNKSSKSSPIKLSGSSSGSSDSNLNYIKDQLPIIFAKLYPNPANFSIDTDLFNKNIDTMANAILTGSDCNYKSNLTDFDACIGYLVWMCDKGNATYQGGGTLPSPWTAYGFDCTLVQKGV
jgi:hypothetical protein